MTERYVDLTLYFGLCDSHGFRPETRFDPSMLRSDLTRSWYTDAMRIVNEYLDPMLSTRYGLTIVGGYLVDNETEALRVIQFAEENMQDANRVIELKDCIHGKIRFFRKIRFGGFTEDRLNELVEQLMGSGYEPKDQDLERLRGFYTSEQIEKRRDKTKPWKEALKFY